MLNLIKFRKGYAKFKDKKLAEKYPGLLAKDAN